MTNPERERTFDVIVAGHGVAGLSAAVSAAEAGARVGVLERAPHGDHGGNTRWTDALMRLKSDTEPSDDFVDHFARNSGWHLDPSLVREMTADFDNWPAVVKTLGMTDPELIGAFARSVPATMEWLKSYGGRFDFMPTYLLTTSTSRMGTVGGGLALVEALTKAAQDLGVTIHYETAAIRLIEEDGVVRGLRALAPGHRPLDFRGDVVLACGGFEGNPAMLTQYLGPTARYIRPVARGGYYNKGEGLRMAMEIGAATAGDFGSIHAEPLDPRSGQPEPVVMVYPYGVLLTVEGERFIDEGPATVDATYEATTRVIQTQPQGIAWAILDSRIDDVPNWRVGVRSDQPPVEAATIPELAAMIGVDAETAAATIAAFNEACPEPDGFKPLEVDGLRATPSGGPVKSNWARRIDKPPFYAFPIICGNCFTFGGLRCDASARVLNVQGDPIPGLYAAGETMGIYHGVYTGATSVLRGAVFGRIAGRMAAGALAEAAE